MTITQPDLSSRPFRLTLERAMQCSPRTLYLAWTRHLDRWFAVPGSILMTPEVNHPFFFETEFEGQRHAHYGRFLRLENAKHIEMTWVTGPEGTRGAETLLVVELVPRDGSTRLRLAHAGFPDVESRDRHEQAWPQVLAQLDERMANEHL